VAEFFPLSEPCGLVANIVMVAHGRGEMQAEPLAACITQGGLLKVRVGFLSQGVNGLTQFQELVFGLSHQLHEDATLASTAAAKGTHDLCEFLLEVLDLIVQAATPVAPLLGDVVDEF
jgi:hypothetical protein